MSYPLRIYLRTSDIGYFRDQQWNCVFAQKTWTRDSIWDLIKKLNVIKHIDLNIYILLTNLNETNKTTFEIENFKIGVKDVINPFCIFKRFSDTKCVWRNSINDRISNFRLGIWTLLWQSILSKRISYARGLSIVPQTQHNKAILTNIHIS